MSQEQQEYIWTLIAKKLSGEANPEELRELEGLLQSNPGLHSPMQILSDMWKQAAPDDRQAAEQAFDRHLGRMEELKTDYDPHFAGSDANRAKSGNMGTVPPFPRKKTRTRHLLILGTALAAASLLGIIFAGSFSSVFRVHAIDPPILAAKVNSEISTRNGSKTHLVLPDGTLVWLNAGSRIMYDKNYGVSQREICLTGEAFFDVARNAEKPFVIHTARIDIKVLGTRFNVKSYPTDKTTEATLIRGSIEVSIKDRPSEKIILKPDEKLVVANDDSTLHRNVPGRKSANTEELLVTIRKPTYEPATGAVIETSWVDNKLIFQDEEFSELAARMERWYGVTIRFASPEVEKWRFTGTFQNETIQQALTAMQLTANFYYSIEGTQITVHNK